MDSFVSIIVSKIVFISMELSDVCLSTAVSHILTESNMNTVILVCKTYSCFDISSMKLYG